MHVLQRCSVFDQMGAIVLGNTSLGICTSHIEILFSMPVKYY